MLIVSDLPHEDYAYLFEAFWDLWNLAEDGQRWALQPSQVKFLVHGLEFEEGVYQQEGHVQADLGLDAPFLQEEIQLTAEAEARVQHPDIQGPGLRSSDWDRGQTYDFTCRRLVAS